MLTDSQILYFFYIQKIKIYVNLSIKIVSYYSLKLEIFKSLFPQLKLNCVSLQYPISRDKTVLLLIIILEKYLYKTINL